MVERKAIGRRLGERTSEYVSRAPGTVNAAIGRHGGPGRCLFGANNIATTQMTSVLARDAGQLPPLPRAKKHQDDSAMHAFLDASSADLRAAAENKAIPGKVDALDLDHPAERPLSLFTRLALTAHDSDDLVRLFERIRNTVG